MNQFPESSHPESKANHTHTPPSVVLLWIQVVTGDAPASLLQDTLMLYQVTAWSPGTSYWNGGAVTLMSRVTVTSPLLLLTSLTLDQSEKSGRSMWRHPGVVWCRHGPHPDVTFCYRWETVVPRCPAQHQLTRLSLCDVHTRDWTGRHCKTAQMLLLTRRHLKEQWNVLTAPRRSRCTLDVDICLSGGGDPLLIVSLAAELSVLVHACKRYVGKDTVALSLWWKLEKKKNTLQNELCAEYLDNTQLSFSAGTRWPHLSLTSEGKQQTFFLCAKCKSEGKVPCQPQERSKTHLNMTHFFIISQRSTYQCLAQRQGKGSPM